MAPAASFARQPIMMTESMTTQKESSLAGFNGVVDPTARVPGVTSWYDSGIRLSAMMSGGRLSLSTAAPAVAAPEAFVTPESAVATPESAVAAPESAVAAPEAAVAALEPPAVAATEAVAVTEPADAVPEPPRWNPEKLTAAGPIDLKKFCADGFLEASPPYLDGTLACDFGFDPLCLAALAKPDADRLGRYARESAEQRSQRMGAMTKDEQAKNVLWMREAELKHSRLAMLAAAGWPLAEKGPFVGLDGRAPSLFNGGLFDFPVFPAFVFVFLGFAIIEANTIETMEVRGRPVDVEGLTRGGYTPGDLGFDPLELYKYEGATAQKLLRNGEIFNGRLAMLAITGFSVQEFVYGIPVVNQTPLFF